MGSVNPSIALLIGKPGSILTQTLQLNSTGVLTDQINLKIKDGLTHSIELPDGNIGKKHPFLWAPAGTSSLPVGPIWSTMMLRLQLHLSFSTRAIQTSPETVTDSQNSALCWW
jgi:hypothetical protein